MPVGQNQQEVTTSRITLINKLSKLEINIHLDFDIVFTSDMFQRNSIVTPEYTPIAVFIYLLLYIKTEQHQFKYNVYFLFGHT